MLVKNHTCPGLEMYQKTAEDRGSCCPRFDKDGETVGCDDSNDYSIEYCPFCGVKLDAQP